MTRNRRAKKAILVGLEYRCQDKLRGCSRDAKRVKNALIAYSGFKRRDMTLIIDTFRKRFRVNGIKKRRPRRNKINSRRIY
jgi:hypothetical protein